MDYQLVGLNWLYLHFLHNYNAILGDEMGLGKTVQVITLLVYIAKIHKVKGPHLVITPTSTLSNWKQEIEKWGCGLTAGIYQGNEEEKKKVKREMESGSLNIVLTSFTAFERAGMHRDRNFLYSHGYVYVIIDEGHCIKNVTAQRYTRLMKLQSRNRLILTGTPVQNNIAELLTLISFVMPSYSTQITAIIERYKTNEEKENEKVIHYVKRILQPFLLRREKSHVLQDLPAKHIQIEEINMVSEQKTLYDSILTQYKENKNNHGNIQKEKFDNTCVIPEDIENMEDSHIFTSLRKIANHPLLIRHIYRGDKLKSVADLLYDIHYFEDTSIQKIYEYLYTQSDMEIDSLLREVEKENKRKKTVQTLELDISVYECSGKVRHLFHLLPSFIQNKEKVLLFSQWVKILDILQFILTYHGYSTLRIDGQTPVGDRQIIVDDFNQKEQYNILLMTTRSGGQGLNLTAANRSILFDVDFNPYVDKQAEDRLHRIGQEKEVYIYKMITKESVDETIYNISTKKENLEGFLLSEEKSSLNALATRVLSELVQSDL
ncbi:hypothetical protein WA158_008462 [Blastocystis sp. Blastoise]